MLLKRNSEHDGQLVQYGFQVNYESINDVDETHIIHPFLRELRSRMLFSYMQVLISSINKLKS